MNNINEALERLSAINNVFSEYILDTNFVRKTSVISWPDYKPGNSKFFYAREYEYLLNNRQYSFLFADRSFMQCYYCFGENGGASILKEVKLCYYPYPVFLKDTIGDYEDFFGESEDHNLRQFYYDLYLCISEEFGFNVQTQIDNAKEHFKNMYGYQWQEDNLRGLVFDKVYNNTNYSHIRMDYDYSVETHHKCELQFGAIKNIRFPVDRILDPFLFFDLIFRYFFKESYRDLINYKYLKNFLLGRNSSNVIENFKENNIHKTLKF
ncbi:hypothetical protein GCM10028807_24150 [Spirosoma daeguense]